ncbi:MAG: NUDIX domain-containing protein, partial [Candidatus Magasanikbacteria bacterium]
RRNDPHNSEFHGKWEFSGGSMNIGETLEENLKREIHEECGYDVQIEKRLNAIGIFPFHHKKGRYSYQVYLIPHICTIVSGNGEFHKEEVMEMRWVSPDEILSYDLIPENKILYQSFSKELGEWIENNHNK